MMTTRTLQELLCLAGETQKKFFLESLRDWDVGNPHLILEYIGHTIEELIEVRMEIPDRKFWSSSRKQMDREAVLEELIDALLLLCGTFAVSGFSPEDVEQALEYKLQKNATRKDHKGNSLEELSLLTENW